MFLFKIKPFFFYIVFFLCVNCFSQATFTSFQDGVWDNTVSSPWSIVGVDADGIPDANDDVIVNHEITMPNGSAEFGSLSINALGNVVLVDGFRVYKVYMGFNLIFSLYYLFCLSLNFLKKKFNN